MFIFGTFHRDNTWSALFTSCHVSGGVGLMVGWKRVVLTRTWVGCGWAVGSCTCISSWTNFWQRFSQAYKMSVILHHSFTSHAYITKSHVRVWHIFWSSKKERRLFILFFNLIKSFDLNHEISLDFLLFFIRHMS